MVKRQREPLSTSNFQLVLFDPGDSVKIKKGGKKQRTNVAVNSIISHYKNLLDGTYKNLQQGTLLLLWGNVPMTRRQIARHFGKEPGSLCNALSQLQKKGLVTIAENKNCPATGHRVSWFAIADSPLVESLEKTLEG